MNIEDVTLVVIPRERFSIARESLESLYANTPPGFRLVYVDGNGTPEVQSLIDEYRQRPEFSVIHRDYYLSNNHARNLGWAQVATPFVVFCDNDVIFAPGWLEALMRCADETGADVVAPLTCEGYPAHRIVHYAGGEYVPDEQLEGFHDEGDANQRLLQEKQFLLKEPLSKWRHQLKRMPTGFCEPHCIFARSATLLKIGDGRKPFDEEMLATKEHLDFCMAIRELGGSIWFEPEACVTFMLVNPARPLKLADVPFFFLRWSDEWQHRSIRHFNEKWRLGKTDFSLRMRSTNYRREFYIKYWLKHLPVAGRSQAFIDLAARPLRRVERVVNGVYTGWYGKHHPLRST